MLELTGVSRSFGDVRALDGVSFSVGRGRLTGFVGGNGAGKTTAMRIILGVLSADAGSVSIDGRPLDAATRRTFGYMPEERGLYPRMKVAEQLAYLARLHGFDRAGAERRARELLTRLDLAPRADDRLDTLSLGNQQRAQIAAALVHEPSLLVLDEPFSGLDPIAVDTVVNVLSERAHAGAPVLFSSHQLDVVERLCDDVVIIAGGRIVAAGDREELRAQYSEPRHRLRAPGAVDWLAGVPGVVVIERSEGEVLFEADDAAAQRVLTEAVARGPVAEFSPVRPSLAEIFREVIRDEAPRTATGTAVAA
ncbi:MAG: ABC transporter ATP-binding protein [Cellulomonas sp. 73-92]|uniref:ABC transporter ATP-binding protein n=1 Tax=Cellulomonas sp. 73-92 TaxID=1895740 RepID=UPI00092B9CAB|nr:ATP-binding cassette domain-containing protein [Cellulomonas sp. 73-92]OJV81566.1 MAG: ABC transporter ATP-binding protein [Cellulomonas sp. 73-92]